MNYVRTNSGEVMARRLSSISQEDSPHRELNQRHLISVSPAFRTLRSKDVVANVLVAARVLLQ